MKTNNIIMKDYYENFKANSFKHKRESNPYAT